MSSIASTSWAFIFASEGKDVFNRIILRSTVCVWSKKLEVRYLDGWLNKSVYECHGQIGKNRFIFNKHKVNEFSHNEQLSCSHFLANDQLWTIPANIGKQNCLLRSWSSGTFKVIRSHLSKSQIVILLQPTAIQLLRRFTLHILAQTFCTRYNCFFRATTPGQFLNTYMCVFTWQLVSFIQYRT